MYVMLLMRETGYLSGTIECATVIKLYFPAKTKCDHERTDRIAASLERSVPAAPGGLIALMDHTQVQHEEYMDRVRLLDEVSELMKRKQTTTWGLDVLDVKVLPKNVFPIFCRNWG